MELSVYCSYGIYYDGVRVGLVEVENGGNNVHRAISEFKSYKSGEKYKDKNLTAKFIQCVREP